MSNTTSKHTVAITDNGSLKQLTAEATKAGAAIDSMGTKSKAASKALAQAEGQEYGRSRGTVGTGAAGRDFAKQSQGLGGLVRVYATFAANLFAVSAAYNALSRAQDTANLVKGLDQLGAASGRNLGTLAKDIVKATDSAVSLREAMTATAQASAAGMSNKDILRMAEGAKKASQALGVDMPDALSRISRGITKLEPELLDEIGIFVRVDKASQDYAKSIGKPVSALTDLEKRAAFANAALTQVESKFGEIKIDSNPYTQLLASMKNVATDGLNLANKVLGPIVGMLAQSPGALAAVLATIGTVLLRQAIPAIGMWREGLKASAIEAEQTANRINNSFTDFDVARKMGPAQAVADAATKEANAAVSKVQTALGKAFSSNSKIVKNAMSSSYNPEANQENIDRQAKAAATKLRNLEEAKRVTSSTDTAHLLALDQAIAKQKEQLALVKLASVENIIASQKMADSKKILDKAEEQVSTNAIGSEGWARERLAKRASAKAQSIGILSNVGTNTQNMGMMESFKELFDAVDKGGKKFDEAGELTGRHTDKLKGLSKASTLARGSLSILTSTIGTMLNAIFPWITGITLLITGFTVLDSLMSTNGKTSEAFSSSIDSLNASLDTVDRTLESISLKTPLEQLSVASIQARSNAFKDLSDNLVTVSNNFIKIQTSSNWWDRRIESIKSIFTTSSSEDMAEELGKTIGKTLDIVGSNNTEYKDKVSKIFGLNTFDLGKLKITFNNLSDSGKVKALREFAKAEEELSNKSSVATSTLVSFSEALKDTSKSSLELTNSFNSNTPVAKLGSSLINLSLSLQKVTESGEASQSALLDLFKNTEALAAIGVDYAIKLANIKQEYEANSASLQQYTASIESAAKAYREFQEVKSFVPVNQSGGRNTGLFGTLARQDTKEYDLQENIRNTNRAANNANSRTQDLQRTAQVTLVEGLQKSFIKGSELLDKSLGLGAEKVSAAIAKGYSVGLTGTQSLNQQKLVTQKEVSVQLKMIEINSEQILATTRLTNVMESIGLLQRQEQELAKPKDQQNSALLKQLGTSIIVNDNVRKALEGTNAQVSKNVNEGMQKGLNSKDPASVEAGIGRALSGQYAAQKGIQAKSSEAAAPLEELRISQLYAKTVAEYTQNTQTRLTYEKEILGIQVSNLSVSDKLAGFTTSSSLAEKQKLELQIQQNEATNAEGAIKASIAGIDKQLAERMSKGQRDILTNQKIVLETSSTRSKELNTLKETNLLESQRVDLLLKQQEGLRELNKLKATPARLKAEIASSDSEDSVQSQQELLNLARDRGRISEDEFTKQDRLQKLDLARISSTRTITELNTKYSEDLEKLNTQYNNTNRLDDDEAVNKILAEMDATTAQYDASVSGAERAYNAEKRRLDLTVLQTSQQKRLEDAINSGASALTDSFFDATQSGKYDFSQMISSMLMDLAKLEFKMSMMKMYNQAGGGAGILGAITNLFTPSAASFGVTPGPGATFDIGAFAKGGAFNGVEMFAKGGTFSNSIVSSPTLFKFAKGTGMMGEAGPEAIMPLKRDANGVLGVQGGGSQTNVVVNNYSGQQVEAHESVDSRGQRKIEVSIGNMVAGEIMRSGSMARQSIKNTFGAQPQLIRR